MGGDEEGGMWMWNAGMWMGVCAWVHVYVYVCVCAWVYVYVDSCVQNKNIKLQHQHETVTST